MTSRTPVARSDEATDLAELIKAISSLYMPASPELKLWDHFAIVPRLHDETYDPEDGAGFDALHQGWLLVCDEPAIVDARLLMFLRGYLGHRRSITLEIELSKKFRVGAGSPPCWNCGAEGGLTECPRCESSLP